MEKKKVVPTWVSVVLMILSVICVVLCIRELISIEQSGFAWIANLWLIIITIVLAVIYCLKGYQKPSAIYFKSALIAYTISCLVSIVITANSHAPGYLPLITAIIQFGCYCVLSIAKDLGKKKSITLWAVSFATTMVMLIFSIITFGLNISYSYILTNIVCAIIIGIMILAKYKDKEARGAK